MRILFYSTRDYEKPYLEAANRGVHELCFTDTLLAEDTLQQAMDFDVVSVFTSDKVTAGMLSDLYHHGVRYIAVRATGYDNVDIRKATEIGIRVANVPHYSPESIAEHAVAMMMALNRKLVLADRRVHQNNFTIDGLVGFTLLNKTAGIIGTGKTGAAIARILHGFGCSLLACDLHPDEELVSSYKVRYTGMEELCSNADIITLHLPLHPQTRYIINKELIAQMKKGVMLINTARGGILHTNDVIGGIESGHIGYFGMDVYENEKGLFFYDHSHHEVDDAMLKKLMSYPNVLITPHQAFATDEALKAIAEITIATINNWADVGHSVNDIA
jgi:D-lactate dehydrogenase